MIALNMIDAAISRGMSIDVDRLSQQLGVPVVPTSASKRTGIEELKRAIAEQLVAPAHVTRDRTLPETFYNVCEGFHKALLENACTTGALGDGVDPESLLPDEYLIQRMLLDRGGESERRVIGRLGGGVLPALVSARQKLATEVGDPIDMECNARYAWAKDRLSGVISDASSDSHRITDRLDAVLTHRVGGLICFVAVMFLIFQSIYSFASWPMDQIDNATTCDLRRGSPSRCRRGCSVV